MNVAFERLSELLFYSPGAPIVVEGEKVADGSDRVESLRGGIHIATRALGDDLAPEVAFLVFLLSLVVLIDGDRNEFRLEQLDNFGISKGRRTVEDAIVSRAA